MAVQRCDLLDLELLLLLVKLEDLDEAVGLCQVGFLLFLTLAGTITNQELSGLLLAVIPTEACDRALVLNWDFHFNLLQDLFAFVYFFFGFRAFRLGNFFLSSQ